MRKLSNIQENPIDNFIYIFVEQITPYLKKLNFTPNIITTIGNISAVYGVYLLYHKNYFSILFIAFTYFCDCVDGYFARKYDMVTVFGDYYDHTSDIIKHILIFIVLYNLNPKLFFKIIPVILFFVIVLSIHFYNQEIIYDKQEESETLSMIKNVFGDFLSESKKDANYYIQYTRYFGAGTSSFVLLILMAIFINTKK